MATAIIDGRKLMQNMTVTIDTTHLTRQMLGIFGWRRRLAMVLFRVAVRVLRCGFELK